MIPTLTTSMEKTAAAMGVPNSAETVSYTHLGRLRSYKNNNWTPAGRPTGTAGASASIPEIQLAETDKTRWN